MIPNDILNKVFSYSRGESEISHEALKTYLTDYPNLITATDPLYNNLGNTLLLNAIAYNKTEIASLLIDLDKGKQSLTRADNYVSGKNTPLLLAIKKGNVTIAKKLIEQIDDEEAFIASDHYGHTPMSLACMLRLDDIIAPLLAKGIDPNEKITIQMIFLPEKPKKTAISPLMLYKNDILPGDIIYTDTRVQIDSNYFSGTRNFVYSDIHWHVKDILINLFNIEENQIDIWISRDGHGNPLVRAAIKDSFPNDTQLPYWITPLNRESFLNHLPNPYLIQDTNAHFGLMNESAKIEWVMLRNGITPNPLLFNAETAASMRKLAKEKYRQFIETGAYLRSSTFSPAMFQPGLAKRENEVQVESCKPK